MASKKTKRAAQTSLKSSRKPRGTAKKSAKRKPSGAGKKLTAAMVTACPTRPYSGTVQIDDNNGRSWLQTAAGTFLMMLDPGCTGVFDPRGVTNAYTIFRSNPGPNGQLTCQAFCHLDGTAQVLHVFR